MKRKVEIKEYTNEFGETYSAIYVDGILFDFAISKAEIQKAEQFSGGDENKLKAIHGDVKKFFIECLRQFLGAEITLKDVNAALATGYIEIL